NFTDSDNHISELRRKQAINLPSNVKKELENNGDSSLTPMVIESVYNQAFITRKRIKPDFTMRKLNKHIRKYLFKKELQSLIQGNALEINRKMSMKAFEFLIKNGLDRENEFLVPLQKVITSEKEAIDLRRDIEKNSIKDDAEYITAMSREKLKELYGELELRFIKTSMEDPNIQIESSVVERINNKYPDMQQKIELVVKISSDSWKKLKHRYFFAKLITTKIYKATCSENKEEIGHSTIKLLNSIFMGEEEDVHKIIQKYTEAQRGFINLVTTSFTSYFYSSSYTKNDSSHISDALEEANSFINKIDDSTFIQDLHTECIFNAYEEIRREIINAFFYEYSKWRSECFIPHVKKILPSPLGLDKQIDCKFDEEFKLLKRELEKREFEKICKKIEEKYSTGYDDINPFVLTKESYLFSSSFHFIYETETTQPDQLQITIYETLLEESDLFELQKNELYVPKPKLFTNNDGVAGIYFQINSGVYELRKFSQFKNKKYFIILWNKKRRQHEIFFDTASRLRSIFESNLPKAFRRLNNVEEDCMFAINEPRGLIGIFNKQSGVLQIYSFDEEYTNLIPHNSNIQILHWYNFKAPDIKHFFFIKDSEELCFVEVGGRARIYNLLNCQFRPGIGQFPANAASIMSTPDGLCIIAFVKETLQIEQPFEDDNVEPYSSDINVNINEKYYAYIYFCTSFERPDAKVIEIPLDMQFFEYFQFSLIHKQIHLTTLDLEN
ncbi:24918_t:CDS:2, partial [Gigaspora margarita]